MTQRAAAATNLRLLGAALLGVGVRAWLASYGAANADGDEAVLVLIGQHAAQGRELAAYFWGQRYLGTLEQLTSAPLLALFPYDVFAARGGPLLWLGLALLTHGALVRRWWGDRAAVLSVLLLSLASWRVLDVTTRGVAVFGSLATFGTGAVYVALAAPAGRWSRRRALAIGALLGLALWCHTMAIVYASAALAPAALRRARARMLRIAGAPTLLLAALAVFADACAPRGVFAWVHAAGLAALGAITLALLVPLGRQAVLVGAGAIAGLLPVWLDWLAGNGPPSANAVPACTTDVPARASLTFGLMLPYLWGVPSAPELPSLTAAQWLLAGPALAFVVAALCLFGWRRRHVLGRLWTLRPLDACERPAAALGILFGAPIGLILLAGNAVDHLALRYLLVTWQAASVLFALFLVWLARRSRVAAAALLALLVWQAGIGGLHHDAMDMRGRDAAPFYRDAAVLADELAARGVAAGYADYYLAYQLDVLAHERVSLAPYNGVSRYAPYEERARAAKSRAFVVPAAWDTGHLARTLAEGTLTGPTRQEVLDLVRRGDVEDRLRVGDWDVWLVRDR